LTNGVSWLTRDRESIGAHQPRRAAGIQQFFLSDEDGDRLFWLTAALQPGVFLLLGLVLAARRRWG
jgi:hypothetical protein